MQKSVIVHVGGARGVGKTTLLEKFIASQGYLTYLVSLGKILDKLALTEFDLSWTFLNDKQKDAMREKAIQYILSLNEYDLIILDSHYADMKESSRKSLMPLYFQQRIDIYIVIDLTGTEIFQRRILDSTKERAGDIIAITEEANAEKKIATIIASENRKPLHVIYNDNIERALKAFCNIIDDCKKTNAAE